MKKKKQGDFVVARRQSAPSSRSQCQAFRCTAMNQARDTQALPLTPCFSWVYHSRIQRKTVLTVYPRIHTHRCINTEGIWRLITSPHGQDESQPIGNLTEFEQIKGEKICHRLNSAIRPPTQSDLIPVKKFMPSKTKKCKTNPFWNFPFACKHGGLSTNRIKPSGKTNPFSEGRRKDVE